MKKKIIFCSGGTGGHVFPAISMIDSLKNERDIILATDKRALKYIKSIEYNVQILDILPLEKKKIILNIFSLIKLFFTFIFSIYLIFKNKIDTVFGFGGYVSFPILLAAQVLKKKIYLYEPNLVLGRTNKFFVNSCEKIFTNSNKIKNVPKNKLHKFIEVGNIIRKEIVNFSSIKKKNQNNEITIIVLGGSQGAKIFGDIVPSVILELNKQKFKVHIIQQAIEEQIEDLKEFYEKNEIKNTIFDFNPNILELICKSDLAITRSGASTIAELEFLQVPFIAVPYPFAKDNHQFENALYYKENGSCWVVEQKNFTFENLSFLLVKILENKNEMESKREKMFYNRRINTLEIIKKEIL